MFNFAQIPLWSVAIFPALIFFLWLLFRFQQKDKKQQSTLSSEYFKGLNYLLNDEQAKALDIFVKLVESDWNTIDTHFALGKIYRKNGEMDKAIKIHQGLIGRPSLPEKYRSKILLELGFDYLDAGWLDRAEGLFKEVLIEDKSSQIARHNLVLIYQQEKDWYKAIDVATELFADDPVMTGPMIAQYYCELAAMAKLKGDIVQLRHKANKALVFDKHCVRATILLAEQAESESDDKAAIAFYESIEAQDVESMTLVLNAMLACHMRLSTLESFYHYLQALEQRQEKLFLQTVTAEVLEETKSKSDSVEYLSEKLKQKPSLEGMQKLLSYHSTEVDGQQIYENLKLAISRMQQERMQHSCRRCGFKTNTHYWLCPSCHHWGQIKPSIGQICKISQYEENNMKPPINEKAAKHE